MTIRINRVYTRSGDEGYTGLVSGTRVRKNDPRVNSYGEIDELNATLGLVRAHLTPETQELDPLLENLQQELFDLGSELATPPGTTYPGMWQAASSDVATLENLCDQFSTGLPELTSFILPGGSKLVAHLHLARTVCRRAERNIVSLAEDLERQASSEHLPFNSEIIKYVNRLSDLLFVWCRWSLDKQGLVAPLWIQAAKRQP